MHNTHQGYRAVVKTTKDGRENFLLSFHRTNAVTARKALRKLHLLRGKLDDLEDD